jgi:hypothetical protein
MKKIASEKNYRILKESIKGKTLADVVAPKAAIEAVVESVIGEYMNGDMGDSLRAARFGLDDSTTSDYIMRRMQSIARDIAELKKASKSLAYKAASNEHNIVNLLSTAHDHDKSGKII